MIEIRQGNPLECRSEGDTVKVSGYAAVFDEESVIDGCYREVVRKGAFAEAVARDDVIFNVNHVGLPLARTGSGTLKITEDERGLYIETELDPTDPDVMQIVPKMKRGDLDKMSFAFVPETVTWHDSDDGQELREIQKVSLVDVSIVNFPAYEGTEIGLRSKEQNKKIFEQREKRKPDLKGIVKRKMNLELIQRIGHPAR